MRRRVCIVALLLGFSGDGYAWAARPRIPVPVERLLEGGPAAGDLPRTAWWRLT